MAEDDASKNSLVEEFCRITNVSPDRGKLFLSSCDWDLDQAVTSYYEEYDPMEAEDEPLPSAPPPPPPPAFDIPKPPSAPISTSRYSSGPRVATMSSLLKDNEGEEEGQAFYAGGSERSGQQVIGPSKKKGPDIVEEMFKAARKHGAQIVDPSSIEQKSKHSSFLGTGYRLGSTPSDSAAPVPDENLTTNPPFEFGRPIECTLRLWQNGFTLDNGALRSYSDPLNKAFLDTIRQGEIPEELRNQYKGREVNLNMEDCRGQAYNPPSTSVQAFAGTGHRLGSPMPTLTSERTVTKEEEAVLKKRADEALGLDPSEPTTNVQVRLSDGTRLIIKCNHKHTLGDIRQYIVTARPEYASSLFSLHTVYPNSELVEDSKSLKELNLLNSSILLKLK